MSHEQDTQSDSPDDRAKITAFLVRRGLRPECAEHCGEARTACSLLLRAAGAHRPEPEDVQDESEDDQGNELSEEWLDQAIRIGEWGHSEAARAEGIVVGLALKRINFLRDNCPGTIMATAAGWQGEGVFPPDNCTEHGISGPPAPPKK